MHRGVDNVMELLSPTNVGQCGLSLLGPIVLFGAGWYQNWPTKLLWTSGSAVREWAARSLAHRGPDDSGTDALTCTLRDMRTYRLLAVRVPVN
jgi:hypothetical protein